jgi:hypothetical protein
MCRRPAALAAQLRLREITVARETITVDASGPVFDGRADAIGHMAADHIRDVIADIAVTDVRAYLPTQYMYLGHHGGTPEFNPVPPDAGALAASVYSEIQVDNSALIRGDRVTYGPWIEGVSSLNMIVWRHRRNPPPRRFPGYHTFRIIAQEINARAGVIAQRELPPFIEEMNR